MIVKKLSPHEWSELSKHAHSFCFGYEREASFDRIDYALLAVSEADIALGFITVKEVNAKHIFWQHGGSFPGILGTVKSFSTYVEGKKWCAQFYDSICTYIDNTNVVMLKFAMKIGFRIIGVRRIFDTTLVELFLNLKE